MNTSSLTVSGQLPTPRRTSSVALALALLRQATVELFGVQAALIVAIVWASPRISVLVVPRHPATIGMTELMALVATVLALSFGIILPLTMPTYLISGASRRQIATASWAVDLSLGTVTVAAWLISSRLAPDRLTPITLVGVGSLIGVTLLCSGTGRLVAVAFRNLPKALTPLWLVLASAILVGAGLWVVPMDRGGTAATALGLPGWVLFPLALLLATLGHQALTRGTVRGLS